MPQDFSHQNLRGRSFKGQDLTGVNFSYADIRSCDFSGTNLKGANFSHAVAGLQKRWVSLIVVISLLLSGLSGVVSGYTGYFASLIFGSSLGTQVAGLSVVITYIIFFLIIIRRGIRVGLGAVAFVVAGGFAVAGVITLSISLVTAIFDTFSVTRKIAEMVGLALIGGFVTAFVTAFGIVFSVGFSIALIVMGKLGILLSVGIATIAAISVALVLAKPAAIAIICDLFILLLNMYVSWQAIKGDEKHSLIRNIAVVVAANSGTNFCKADLTDANFIGATLKNTDLKEAILTRTYFRQTKKLNFARPGITYLKNLQLCPILVTGQGQAQNFDHQNLRGVNLQGANLTDASFIGADLSEANLQDADLTRAKLVQTQLDGTDFTGATLTGAYIEDWNITTDTKFDGVRCEYVYMRLPTQDNPDPHRKPDNRQEVFADGEFGDFIKPIFDTLDLYHNQGVDPRAIAISFKQLAENNPDAELEIVAMEKRGQDKFLLRAKTAIAADKSQLSAEYFAMYNQLKALTKQEVKALIAEKDSRISKLETMVMTALERPSFYSNVEQVGFMTNNPGGFSVGGSVSGDINNVQGDHNQQRVSNKTSNFNLQNAQFGGGLVNADTVNAEQIGGNITNYNPEQKQNLAQAAAEIQQLLNQLSQTYPTATTSERMSVVAKAVDEIESNPALKARVIGALKAGGTEAFKELIDHPLVNILLASIQGWQEAE